jgi:hypothetical protein
VATSDSSLASLDRQVFMAAGETPGPSGTRPNQYLEDISTDELSADAPAEEIDDNKKARRERNRKRNERRRRLRETLRMRTGQVIAKLAEDAYFMKVDNRVAQVPPTRTRQPDNEATSRSPADNRRIRTRGELPTNPNRTRASAGGPFQGDNSAGGAGGNRDVVPHHDPGGGGSGGGRSSHGAGRRAGGRGDRGGRGHANSHASGVSRGGYDARQTIEELRRKKSSTAGDNDRFPAFSAWIRNLLLPEKFKPLGITKYDAKQDPV